jgi:hypothetical protein
MKLILTAKLVILHKADVFEAIKISLLEENNLNYSKLYEKVNEKLKLSRNKPKVKLSTRDFGSEINILLNEGLLIRRADLHGRTPLHAVSESDMIITLYKKEKRLDTIEPNMV